jgi:hypothetical protein
MSAPLPEKFLEEGRMIFRGRKKDTKHKKSLHKELDLFRAFFGTWPCICTELWNRISPLKTIHPKSITLHLLWALLLMCCYATEDVNACITGVDKDTLRFWAMPWIEAISSLSMELIDFDRRFDGKWHYWTFVVDGIHCAIQEPRRPFWRGWYSHKFEGAGLAYEVATAVTTGLIVWINGPFPAGKWKDDTIFMSALAKLVRPGIEKGVADAGYRSKAISKYLFFPAWRTKKGMEEKWPRNDLHEHIRARHETINARLHKWNCVGSIFRHARELHSNFFHAAAVVVQLEIIHGFTSQFCLIPQPWTEPETYKATLDPMEQYPTD